MDSGIVIKDNFFNKKEFNILHSNVGNIKMENLKNGKGEFYGFGHSFERDKNNQWMFDKIKKSFFPEKNLEPFDIGFTLRNNKNKPLVHIDEPSDYNFLLYLKGNELLYNGTGFYNHENKLDRYIGFVENRALFFSGKSIYHSDLQALGESSPRYCINIFYKEINNG